MFVDLLLVVTVLSDLYKLMDEAADHAEEIALEQPNLRDLFRYIYKYFQYKHCQQFSRITLAVNGFGKVGWGWGVGLGGIRK